MGRTAANQKSIERRNALVEEAMPAIRNVAFMVIRRFCNNVEVDDLIQQGCLGALQAADKFDPSLGIPFPAFAYQRIRGAMYDSLRRGKYNEMACLSLDTPLRNDDPERPHIGEWAEDERPEPNPLTETQLVADIDNRRRLKKVSAAMSTLTPRQRKVVEIHYLDECSLREAGEQIGLSQPRAAQIRVAAITQIRAALATLTDVA